jgi:hypothetical protein
MRLKSGSSTAVPLFRRGGVVKLSSLYRLIEELREKCSAHFDGPVEGWGCWRQPPEVPRCVLCRARDYLLHYVVVAAMLDNYQNREAACCPEDVGFDEVIARLTAERDRYEKALLVIESVGDYDEVSEELRARASGPFCDGHCQIFPHGFRMRCWRCLATQAANLLDAATARLSAVKEYVQHKPDCDLVRPLTVTNPLIHQCACRLRQANHWLHCILKAGHDGLHRHGPREWPETRHCTCGLDQVTARLSAGEQETKNGEKGEL